MIPVSAAWKAAMNSDTGYTTSAVIALADGTSLTVTPSDVRVEGNRFTDGPQQNAFPVGAAMSRSMQINLENADGRYAGVDFLGAVIDLALNYRSESVAIGRFTVQTPETYGETVIITAQDDMIRADRPFSSALTFPTTAGALWNEICAACGIVNGMQTIPGASAVIRSAPSSDLTCRAVLGYIAMLSGGNARISRSGELEIVNYDFAALAAERQAGTAESIHDLAMWRSLRLDREDVNITGVQTTVYDGERSSDVLVGADGYVLALENPLFAGREREALAGIAAALGMVCPGAGVYPGAELFPGAITGAAFRAFSGEYIAYPLAEFGDGARITDRRGDTYYTFITDVDFRWFSPTSLECRADSPIRAASRYSSPDAQTIRRAAQITRNALVEDLKLFGSMRVYTDDRFTTPAGEIGFTTGQSATDIGQGLVMWDGHRSVIITGDGKLFIGFYSDDDPWFDGGEIKINSGNYQNYVKFEDGLYETGPNGETSQLKSGAQLYLKAADIYLNGREVLNEIGSLSGLSTTNKSSLVAAINELAARITALGG